MKIINHEEKEMISFPISLTKNNMSYMPRKFLYG